MKSSLESYIQKEKLYLTTSTSNRSRNYSKTGTDYIINKTEGILITEYKKNEIDLKKKIKILQNKRKDKLKFFHHNTLAESLRSTNFTNTLTSTPMATDYTTPYLKTETNMTKIESLPINKNFFYKNISTTYKAKESLGDFKNKTMSLVRMKYFLDLEKCKRNQIEEDIFNEEDEQKVQIRTYMNNYQLFEEYLLKLIKYKRNLEIIKEVEQINLGNSKDDLVKIIKEISMLQYRREKNIEKLNLLKEYKKFLENLKNKTDENFSENFKENVNDSMTLLSFKRNQKFNYISSMTMKEPNKLNFMRKNNGNNTGNIFMNMFSKNTKLLKNEIDENLQGEINVYSNSHEVLLDFQKLQNKLMDKVRIYNDLNDDYKKILNQPEVSIQEIDPEIKSLQKKLKRLKEQNMNLIMEKNKISKHKENNHVNENMYLKIKEIYENLNHLKIFSINNISKFKKDNFGKNDEIIFMLKKLEGILNYLKSKYDSYMCDPEIKKLMITIEKNLDKERKLYLKKQNEEILESKNKQMIQQMHEKHDRLVIAIGRKYAPRFKKDDLKKEKDEICDKDLRETEFNEYISF